MKFSRLLPWIVIAALVAGCKSSNTAQPELEPKFEPNKTSTEPTPPTPNPGATPGGEKPTPGNPMGLPKTPEKPPLQPVPVKPGATTGPNVVPAPNTGGFDSQKEMTAEAIGTKVDYALTHLTNTVGAGKLDARTEDKMGYNLCKIFIGTKGVYSVEYPRPEMPFQKSLIVSDGIKHATRDYETVTTDVNIAKASEDYVDEWPQRFTELALVSLSDQRPVYAPLMKALQSGKGGYKTSLDKMVTTLDGVKHTMYRIVATRTEPDTTTIEIRVDGDRWLPITLRVNRKVKGGEEFYSRYALAWQFGQKVNADAFAVPTTVKN